MATLTSELVEDLDEAQARAVTTDAMPLCVLAGAGSGKTRVLTRRVARRVMDGSADSAHSLVLTFTRKAAGELSHRLSRLDVADGITIGTFHAVAYAELRRYWLDEGRPVPSVLSNPQRVIDAVLAEMRLNRSVNPRLIASEISWAKSRRLTPEGYGEGVSRYQRRPPTSVSQLTRIYRSYENEKRKRRTLDYDDLLLSLTDLLETDRAYAAAQRWRFRHLFVDEFQDLNRAQFDLMKAWLSDRPDLFVVGDPNQAIYGWNGADASYLTAVDRHFPGIDIISLTSNYRSTAHVLAAANAVLPNAGARQPSVEGHLSAPQQGEAPKVRSYGDEVAEAAGIAREVRLAHGRSWRWADIAVLVRTNAQRMHIESALSAARIPFRSTGGAAWLFRPEVKEALELLRAAPRHRLNEKVPDIEQMHQDAPEGEASYLAELIAGARQCLRDDPTILIADFLSWIEVASKQDGPVAMGGHRGAVTVTTFHRAKGLEWPVVFLAGLEEGLVPYGTGGQSSLGQLDEEQRLFYVAVTRAREELHCSWARQRMGSAGPQKRSPSPWLLKIEQASAGLDGVRPSPAQLAEVMEETRSGLNGAPEDRGQPAAESSAKEALVRWRSSRSKLTGIRPDLILSDAVLAELAEKRPSEPEQFADIKNIGPVMAASLYESLAPLWQTTPKALPEN